MTTVTSAVVVGGSLSGLLHGLQLKRMGIDVTILEQDTNSERSSHNAGIQVSDNVNDFLRLHDSTGQRLAVESHATHFSIPMRNNVFKGAGIRYWTNWGLLYRVLRANFDGYASQACPEVPAPRSGDGRAQYLTGKRVTDLQYHDGLITLHHIDQADKRGTITSELVIGADGSRSTIRSLVQAPHAAREQYTGFFAWRGTIPRNMLSKQTAAFFQDNVSFAFLGSKIYILCYTIPTDLGCFDSDDLLLNWLIYQDLAEGSLEESAIFTDIKGQFHQRTVPQGLTNPAVWESHRETLIQRMTPPFAELVAKSPTPFVTKITELLGSQATFCDGHVLLVGDALTTYRPNVGRATDQAASHALTMGKTLRGDKSLEVWNSETCREAKRVFLLSRIMSEIGRGTWFSLAKALAAYLLHDFKSKSWRSRL